MDSFVMRSVELAQQWVEMCAKGLELKTEQSAAMLATLCGFGSWDIMTYAIETMPPSKLDEDLPEEQRQGRLKGYVRVLVHLYEMDVPLAMFLLTRLPPSSRRPFVAFSAEPNLEIEESDFNAFKAFAADFLHEDLGDECPHCRQLEENFSVQVDPTKMNVAMSLCDEIELHQWEAILGHLGWSYDSLSDELHDIDVAAFAVQDMTFGAVPVYLSPTVPQAFGDQVSELDPAIRLLRKVCVGDYVANWQTQTPIALLLSRWPLVKEIDGRVYCHLGSVYYSQRNEWKDLFFSNACTSIAELLRLNDFCTDIEAGCVENSDLGGSFTEYATLALSDFDPEDAEEVNADLTLISLPISESMWMLQRYVDPDYE